MPQARPPTDVVDLLLMKAKGLEREVQNLRYKHRPTLPIYDQDAFPDDAVEGQHAITSNGCYAWYQGGLWHVYCPDDRDPFVAVPTNSVFLNVAKASGQSITRAPAPLGLPNPTVINYLSSAALSNNDLLFISGSAGWCYFIDTVLGTRYEFSSVPWPVVSGGQNISQFLPTQGNIAPQATQLIATSRVVNAPGGAIGAYTPFPVLGPSTSQGQNLTEANGAMVWCFDEAKAIAAKASGTNIPFSWSPGNFDSGPSYKLGQHAMMGVAFPSNVMYTSPGTWNPNELPSKVSSGGVGDGITASATYIYARLTLPAAVVQTDHIFLFGLIIGTQTDALDFANSRVVNLGSTVVGNNSTDWNPYRMYLCARTIAASLMPVSSALATSTIDIRIPWKAGQSPQSWAFSGKTYKLASITIPS